MVMCATDRSDLYPKYQAGATQAQVTSTILCNDPAW